MVPHSRKAESDNASSLRVIGAGLPRTGTSSLKAALEILGFGPCHHMSELMDKPERGVIFARALDGHKVDFYTLMKGYGSTVDVPTAEFYKEIRQAYPEAKIVLTVRDDGKKWFESLEHTIRPYFADDLTYFAIYPISFIRSQFVVARKIWRKWTAEYGGVGPWVHEQHNIRVINENKEGEILVFNVKEGWPPLCKFLGVDVPERIPFPNVNDTKTAKRILVLSTTIGSCFWTIAIALIAIVVYLFIGLII